MGDFTSARKAYKKALALDPGNAMIRINFALFEYRRGNLSDSAALIQNVNVKNLGESPEASVTIKTNNSFFFILIFSFRK